jgi:hypothetical protein
VRPSCPAGAAPGQAGSSAAFRGGCLRTGSQTGRLRERGRATTWKIASGSGRRPSVNDGRKLVRLRLDGPAIGAVLQIRQIGRVAADDEHVAHPAVAQLGTPPPRTSPPRRLGPRCDRRAAHLKQLHDHVRTRLLRAAAGELLGEVCTAQDVRTRGPTMRRCPGAFSLSAARARHESNSTGRNIVRVAL